MHCVRTGNGDDIKDRYQLQLGRHNESRFTRRITKGRLRPASDLMTPQFRTQHQCIAIPVEAVHRIAPEAGDLPQPESRVRGETELTVRGEDSKQATLDTGETQQPCPRNGAHHQLAPRLPNPREWNPGPIQQEKPKARPQPPNPAEEFRLKTGESARIPTSQVHQSRQHTNPRLRIWHH